MDLIQILSHYFFLKLSQHTLHAAGFAILPMNIGIFVYFSRMGIHDLFASGSADLTGISPDNNIALNSAQHKTFLKVDPTGTTASASFAQTQTRGAQYLMFDRPFLLIIREKYTKMPMFMGRIANPAA
jgi:serine protease inhibitor